MSKSHDNITAIGSLSLNEKWNTNFQNSPSEGRQSCGRRGRFGVKNKGVI